MPVAFHGLAEGEAEVAAGGVEVRVDRERAAEQRGGLAMLTNLFMIYTTSEPVEYVLPGQPATAAGQ